MPTSVDIKNLKINKLTEAQYDTAVQGGVIGENELSVITDMVDKAVQVSTMPTASADELGNIYQYVGTTDANHTNGYFYKCEGAGDPVVYSWAQVNVQPGSSLPSQSGNDGKFLTTSGTDASWGNRTHELIISGRDDVSEGGVLSIKPNNRNYASGIRFYGTDNTVKSYLRYDASAGSSAYHGVAINANDYQYYRFCPTHFGTNSDNYFSLGAATLRWANVYTYKLNNGADISVPTVGGKLALQIDTMPTAASSYEGVIYQFTGTTDSTYTNGRFYKCVSDGQSTPTYSWEEVSMGGSSLPSQTGQSGKFLTTDGTDASWSDKPLVNNASAINTGNLAIGKNTYTYWAASSTTAVGDSSGANGTFAVAVGNGAIAGSSGVAIGKDSLSGGGVAIGYKAQNTSSGNPGTMAIGTNATVSTNNGIQIGGADNAANCTNSEWGTVKISLNNVNYKMLDSNGTIPTDRLTKVNTTITLAAADWSSNSQTVNVTGMTATGIVMVSPDPTDQADYTAAGIICSAQAAGTLTFTCDSTPANDIDVVVVML